MVSHTETKCGGGGLESDICEVLTLGNSAKIIENKSVENIHTDGFNHPRSDSRYPAKTNQD